MAVGVTQAVAAPASPQAQPMTAALPATLTPAAHAALLRTAAQDSAATARSLHLGSHERLIATDVIKDRDGTVHTRYQRTYDGVPVLGGDLVVHQRPGSAAPSVTKASRAAIAVASLTPKVSAATAESAALKTALAKTDKPAGTTARKVIWAAKGTPVLAWETVVGGFQDDGTPSALHVVTDANTGRKLFQYQGIETGTGTGQYNGKVTIGTTKTSKGYTLTDGSRGGHKTYDLKQRTSGTGTLFTNSTDTWGNGSNSNRQTAGVDAHYGAQETWDYYKNVHGRTGIRGDGVAAYSRTHYGNSYVNAFWDDSCFCMTYGDGANNAQPLTALDVAGHEMSHGVTSATAGLDYSDESGGLNEATSDIFGTSVEFYANNPAAPGNYLIGEQININGDGTPLRYMDKPSKDGSSADYWYSGVGNLDVHYSSGPANHFFYLLSEGSGAKTVNGFSYDSPTKDGKPVPGIGRANAEKVWYKALTQYMTSTTDYAGARTATLQAAADLFGQGSATYNTVANTWAAIGVGSRVS
nr:M4 family metallopeptidase [Streptomyces sp. SID5468]